MSSLEKAQEQLSLRQKEASDKLSNFRHLQTQLHRLESQLKEMELAAHGDKGETSRKELRDLTKKKIDLELQVANARFDYEDAMDRVREAERVLQEAQRAAAVARLTELSRKRLELVEKINGIIDAFESDLEKYNVIVAEQQKLADELGMQDDRFETENGLILRLSKLLETQGQRLVKPAPERQGQNKGQEQARSQTSQEATTNARRELAASAKTAQAKGNEQNGFWAGVRRYLNISDRMDSVPKSPNIVVRR